MSSLERLAAASLLPSFVGLEPPDWLRRRLADGLGGVVLFARNVGDPQQLAALTAALRAEREDAVVAIDEEGGDVTRLEAERGSSYPGNRALGTVDDPELTERVAAALGADLADVGINLDLAPVADLASDPRSPIVGVRSFGRDPELVARHVAAFVRGLQGAGVAACTKHFPGHGGTALDSHLELPTVDKPARELIAEDVLPFRAAVEAGARAIMTAHIRVPTLDATPATISREIVTGLLRGELGFRGMVITDALEMQAVSANVGVENAAVAALAAGADALCLGADLRRDDVDAVARAIGDAVKDGALAEERLREAGERVRAIATAEGDGRPRRENRAIGLEAARRALRVEGVVALERAPFVVELRPRANIAAGRSRHGLAELLPSAAGLRLDAPRAVAVREDRQLVVVVRDGHRYAWERELAEGLVGRHPDAVVVETGLPIWRPPGVAGYVATYGGGRVNLEAAAERLAGQQAST